MYNVCLCAGEPPAVAELFGCPERQRLNCIHLDNPSIAYQPASNWTAQITGGWWEGAEPRWAGNQPTDQPTNQPTNQSTNS